jgi:hypothetical protein
MNLRHCIVFTVFLLMLVAAPVWANTAALQDFLRDKGDDGLDGVAATDRTACTQTGCIWMR